MEKKINYNSQRDFENEEQSWKTHTIWFQNY